MFEKMKKFFGRLKEHNFLKRNKEEAKERLHLVLMQDRANVSADFLDMMKQEIIDVIKKYIDVDDKDIDVKLTNKQNSDGTTGAPALYANIPIKGIKSNARKMKKKAANPNAPSETIAKNARDINNSQGVSFKNTSKSDSKRVAEQPKTPVVNKNVDNKKAPVVNKNMDNKKTNAVAKNTEVKAKATAKKTTK